MKTFLQKLLKIVLKIFKWGVITALLLLLLFVVLVGIAMYRDYKGYGHTVSRYLYEEWRENNKADTFYVDLSDMSCEWDTLYHYRAYPPSDIDEVNEAYFTGLHKGCKLVFKQDGETVWEDEYYCPCCEVEGTVMISPYAEDWKIDRSSAKFVVNKTDGLFYLQRVDSLTVQCDSILKN